MKIISAKSSARWVFKKKGHSEIAIDSALLDCPRNSFLATNFRTVRQAAELLAAAHALSFTTAFIFQLRSGKLHHGRIHTTATVTLENTRRDWTVTKLNLDVLARLPQLSQCDFVGAAVRAKTGCFVSRLTKTTVWMNAKLESASSKTTMPASRSNRRASPSNSSRPLGGAVKPT
jgi:osmotically inducible protein OsmC